AASGMNNEQFVNKLNSSREFKMKTKRSLVVRVTLITATLLLTACAQPEQSSLAGDWLLTPKDKTRGLTGSIAVNIAPSRCKTNCRGD
ncbi:hypothetical protein Q604_UNBC08107G0001, partial [human gut metagenome]